MNKKQIAITGTIIAATNIFAITQINHINHINLINMQHEYDSKLININKQNQKLNEVIKQNNIQIKSLSDKVKNQNDIIESMKRKVSCDYNDLSKTSGITEYHLHKAFKGSKMTELIPYIVEAEKKYNVNGIFLSALIAHESYWNNSKRANEDNNLTGHCVYTTSSRGSTFDNKRGCILTTSELLAKEYLNPKGTYYNGNSIWEVNKSYCLKQDKKTIDWNWSRDIISIANSFINKINEG